MDQSILDMLTDIRDELHKLSDKLGETVTSTAVIQQRVSALESINRLVIGLFSGLVVAIAAVGFGNLVMWLQHLH